LHDPEKRSSRRVLESDAEQLQRGFCFGSGSAARRVYDCRARFRRGSLVFAAPQAIVGREQELRDVSEFLDGIEAGPIALVLEGELGIGKTALWNAGLAVAVDRSYRVLVCRPVESEAQLAYAALGDLLADVPDEAMEKLPAPQRRALEVALLRREPEGQPSQRAVAVGTLAVLCSIADERPTVLGIDDVQWLDEESRSALAFVARRVKDERIGVFATRRLDASSTEPLDLERALAVGRSGRLRVGPLEAHELDRLLAARLDERLPEHALARIHDRSGGNPFFALEIGRVIRQGGDSPDDDGVPIPASLHELVRNRLALLSRPAREATEIASALSKPTPALIDAVRGSGDSAAAIGQAATAGIVELDGGRVRFAHPLLASITYAQITPDEQRGMHARLAEILDDPEERGRHLALATEHADAGVAAALDVAARRARARGAPGAAAALWEHARLLTPADAGPDARRRGLEAAERRFDAGDVERARTLFEDVAAESSPGKDRAQALARLGWVCAHAQGFDAAEKVFRDALAEHANDRALRIEIEQGLSWCSHMTRGVAAAEVHARSALHLAEELGEPSLLASTLSHVAFLEALKGESIPLATIERAVALGQAPEWAQILGRPDWIHALLLEWAGELSVARSHFEALYRAAVDGGDEHSLPFILYHFARIELLTGDWQRAREHAHESRETTLQGGLAMHYSFSLGVEALVDAHLGLVETARAKIDEGLQVADELGSRSAGLELLGALGFLELSLGHAREADRALGRLAVAVEETGLREPALFRFHGDAIEAKIALGEADGAEALVTDLDRRATSPWALVAACRGRALLSGARGDLRASRQHLEHALGLHDRLEEPFERARTLVILGNVLRRDRQKRAAREALEGALEIFRQLGAALWEKKAHAELARVGGRAPATAELTPTEQQVAELIASGLTYRATADALFISPKTVQWNLSKVYRKLGIRSRTELPARLAAERGPSGPAGSSPAGTD
jgi:DNA-binding CsgD family transcriptional regulator